MVDAIFEASTRILVEAGPAAMNTNSVAERAGVSVGSLYQYFPNRDAILVALLERFEANMHARMETALRGNSGGFESGLSILIGTALAYHAEQASLASILEAEEMRLGMAAVPILAQAERRMTRFVQTFVGAHTNKEDHEVRAIAHRMEIVGRTLVDDATRRSDQSSFLLSEIVAVMSACVPKGFLAENYR